MTTDNEAQKKVVRKLKSSFYDGSLLVNPYSLDNVAKGILRMLHKLGYRELPKDKPSLIIDNSLSRYGNIEAQRDADIRHYEGVEK